ncbi:hypothetical protein Dimus_015505, partial [Dionaea muscipula]
DDHQPWTTGDQATGGGDRRRPAAAAHDRFPLSVLTSPLSTTRGATKGNVSLVLTFRFSSFVSLLRFSLLDETSFGVSDNSLNSHSRFSALHRQPPEEHWIPSKTAASYHH